MFNKTKDYLSKVYMIDEKISNLCEKVEKSIKYKFEELDEIKAYNQYKVLRAFQKNKISDAHFAFTTGYGYGDIGRDSLDRVYADAFNSEDCIVRPHFVSGTHAISVALFGNLRPGDKILAVTGKPYDTLEEIIGIRESRGSLKEYGVGYIQINLAENSKPDFESIKNALISDDKIRLVEIQRSTGYGWRPALTLKDIEDIIVLVKKVRKDVICFVDNCYGEFLDTYEPTEAGADLMAGSLIKNPGGGIAPTGGYIAGKKEYVENASYRLTSPGIGRECGSTFGVMRQLYQGFFLAPHVTMEALKGAIFCSKSFETLGFEVCPEVDSSRSDIIQGIKFKNKDTLIAFCQGIQKGSPIDSFVNAEPWDMPGYNDQVIMAAGAFIQGSSIELSADAPIREPYIAYLQGGLTYEHAKIGIMIALQNLLDKGYISL
ncbi:methionine gamma-lyase [Oxobacter pfennigii]|uniref:Methionine gamma-lyase n=1 Tax=Oxobacter pfennigii TaxID=36849 RepID=A0A0N8NTH4_9CLOT|nr:methionine gamma-lyase family protein [Oxobacter pfennigii]KPU44840.1 methionine gamma-lyase [Oxobacter pfennigii]